MILHIPMCFSIPCHVRAESSKTSVFEQPSIPRFSKSNRYYLHRKGAIVDANGINDRISRLQSWKQTDSLNEILYNALLSLSEYSKMRFDNLTNEIRKEKAAISEAPVIKVGVCNLEDVDKHLFLHPVSDSPPISRADYVTTIFVEAPFPIIVAMLGKTYPVETIIAKVAVKLNVGLRYSTKYLQKLETLYHIYSRNELLWRTVNSVYFYKFLDVFCRDEAFLLLEPNAKKEAIRNTSGRS